MISVLEFGSSILRREDDLPRVVHEIYRAVRLGHRVVAVVSALGDATHAALARAGLRCSILDALQAGLRARGPTQDAELVGVDAPRIRRELDASGIVVVPGFAAHAASGATCLPGRGGSDLTALFLAWALEADCVLYQDVDGLYDADPSRVGRAQRFRQVRWETAVSIGGGVVQEKALRFAQARGLGFSITQPGAAAATRVGPGPDLRQAARPVEPLRVALLGHGTVGSGLYRHLAQLPDHFHVVGIAVRDPRKAEAAGAPAELLADKCWRTLQKPADVVVELIGGTGLAARAIAASLKLGRHVVTANKTVIAWDGPRLEEIARAHRAQLLYSASVGGALPALETLRRSAGQVRAFSGVLNSTSNFVLDSIAEGYTQREAMEAAQRAGYAEADPRLDLNGTDAAQKLVILARAAFGRAPDRIHCTGIARLDLDDVRCARRNGHAIRLVATCRSTARGLAAEVAPQVLPLDHPLGTTAGVENRLFIERRAAPPLLLSAAGAGRWPTAEAVLADLYDLRNPASQGGSTGFVGLASSG
jgi:homoserine dehydrogenase